MIRPIRNMRGAVVVWLVSYIFFLFSLVSNFSASHDSINYLLHISRGEHLFHQHHLLYHFLANAWLRVIGGLGDVPAHYVVESFTALWGSLNLAICYLFFRNRFNLPVALSIAGICAIAFSFGTWFYSVNIEVYAPPVFFILCALYVMTGKRHTSSGQIILIAVLHGCAILFHQLNILFSVVFLFWLFGRRNEVKIIPAILQYALIGTLLCGGVYFYAGWIVEKQNTPEQFANWILGYTKGHSYWQSLSFRTPVNVAAGFARSFIGGHFAFELPALKAALEQSFRTHGLRDEMFLVRNVGGTVAWVLTALSLLFGGLLAVLVFRFARKYKSMATHFHVINPLLATIAVYSLFFCFWMPEILEFWILQMILVWLLVIGMLPLVRFPFRLSSVAGTALLAGCLFAVNYFGSIRWLKDADNDWYYVEAQKLDKSLTPEDVVILEDEWILKDYVRYYSNATVVATDETQFTRMRVEEMIKKALAADRRIFIHKKDAEGQNTWVTIQSY